MPNNKSGAAAGRKSMTTFPEARINESEEEMP